MKKTVSTLAVIAMFSLPQALLLWTRVLTRCHNPATTSFMSGARAKTITPLRNPVTTPKPRSWHLPPNPAKIAGLSGRVWKTKPVLISDFSAASPRALPFSFEVPMLRLLLLVLTVWSAPAHAAQNLLLPCLATACHPALNCVAMRDMCRCWKGASRKRL